ncbi:MAG: helix-turn-helix transcriptional regulator [Lachnospiraceae bacterium]|nr:helix-turn-helix transcriptional regulator [Lachnospiraceae bacterium]
MTSKEMGDIICRLKHQKKISGKKLCSGICSQSVLFRFESGETPIDYLSLKYLLSRLGKSINKVDNMLNNDDFEFLTLHSMINDFLMSGDVDSAEDLLNEYCSTKRPVIRPLKQYFQKVRCVIQQKRGLSSSELVQMITATLKITIHDFSLDRVANYLLSEDEWLLLFMLLEQTLKADDTNATKHISSVYRIFNSLEFDQEAWIMLYPKISWLYMQACNSLDEKITLCEDVLNSLRENTRLLHLDEFLYVKCQLYKEKYGESDSSYIYVQRQYDALLWIYEDAGRTISTKPEMWFSVNNPEIYLLPEVVRTEREVLNISQEKAGDKFDIDQKTFSRIETGTNRPKPSTLTKIKETLGMYRGIHNTLLVVSDFEDLELENQLTRAISKCDYRTAQNLLNELQPKLCLNHKENAQYVIFTQTLINYWLKIIDTDEALIRCINAFEITRPYDENSFDKIILSRMECSIAHLISFLYEELHDYSHSTSLLECIVRGFSRSRINPKYHYRELSLILLSLSYNCKSQRIYSKAYDYSIQGLSLQFDFHRCNMIPLFLTQKYFVLESQNLSEETVKNAYKKIYIAESLFLKSRDVALEKYFHERFGENISDYS